MDQLIDWEPDDPGTTSKHQVSSPSALDTLMWVSNDAAITECVEGDMKDTGDEERACDVIETNGLFVAGPLGSVATCILHRKTSAETDTDEFCDIQCCVDD